MPNQSPEPNGLQVYRDLYLRGLNPANQWNDGNHALAVAQSFGWAAFVVGTLGAGATGTGLTVFGIYMGKNAATAGVATGVEWAIAEVLGDDRFDPFSAYTRNFAIDMASGWLLPAGGGGYLAHVGREVAIGTAADAVWLVGIEGRDLEESLTEAIVGNVAGQVVGDVLSAGARRSFRRTISDSKLRFCFVAGTSVVREMRALEPKADIHTVSATEVEQDWTATWIVAALGGLALAGCFAVPPPRTRNARRSGLEAWLDEQRTIHDLADAGSGRGGISARDVDAAFASLFVDTGRAFSFAN